MDELGCMSIPAGHWVDEEGYLHAYDDEMPERPCVSYDDEVPDSDDSEAE